MNKDETPLLNLQRTFVGVALELITIDLRNEDNASLQAVKRISNNVKTLKYKTTDDQLEIVSDDYTYLPCEITGVTSGPSNQSATLTVSNVTGEMSEMFKIVGAFAGGKVSRIRTFLEYIEDVDSINHYPYDSWKILQMVRMNRHEAVFSLGSSISESNCVVPPVIMASKNYPGMTS